MKGYLLSLLFMTGCVAATEPDWSWLTGNWVNDSETAYAQETWSVASDSGAVAFGQSINKQKQRQRFFEFLRIMQHEGRWVYRALPAGKDETDFALIKWDAQSADFANPAHDFPQNIRYWREGDRLCATVSGVVKGKTEAETTCWTKQ